MTCSFPGAIAWMTAAGAAHQAGVKSPSNVGCALYETRGMVWLVYVTVNRFLVLCGLVSTRAWVLCDRLDRKEVLLDATPTPNVEIDR